MSTQQSIFAARALLDDGWAHAVRVAIAGGIVTAVEKNASPAAEDARVDVLLPALSNLHSHSF